MELTLLLPPSRDERKWSLAAQLGVRAVVTKAAPDLSGLPAPYDFSALRTVQERLLEAGFELRGLEGDQFDMSRIKLGLPGRDEDIERYRRMIANMGRLGIRLLCYNFMATIGWFRTKTNVLERGGAHTSEFRLSDVDPEPVPPEGRVTEERLWENLEYFLAAVLPVAESEGVVMAMHPDDPPVSPLRGVGRILTTAAAFDRALGLSASASHQVAFCQATFLAMGEDIRALSARWLADGRIAFIHLRDVEGDRTGFRETFHDNGPTPMGEMLAHYHHHGFDGPVRPDHTPAMYGEYADAKSEGIVAGYDMMGRLFAVGYLRALCEAKGIPIR